MTSNCERYIRIALPQILLILLLSAYLYLSALLFRILDKDLANQPIYDVILFEFSSLATIGYGNIAPSTDSARLFAILFAIIGIPITILTLANLGKHTSKAYWHVMKALGLPSARANISADAPMPILVIVCLFILTFVFGSVSVGHTETVHSIDHMYFSFISFATVGFGDKCPVTNDLSSLILTLSYLIWGCMLTTSLFQHLSQYFRKPINTYVFHVHYFGRRFAGARDVPVWVGGRSITVSQLLSAVAKEFEAPPHEIRSMLRDLDDIIPRINEQRDKRIPLVTSLEDFDYIDS